MSNAESNSGTPQTFWDHLEELRGCILRMLAAAAAAAAAAFGFKEELFGIVLAPADPGFITYRILGAEPFKFQLINTGLTEQFMIHLKTGTGRRSAHSLALHSVSAVQICVSSPV